MHHIMLPQWSLGHSIASHTKFLMVYWLQLTHCYCYFYCSWFLSFAVVLVSCCCCWLVGAPPWWCWWRRRRWVDCPPREVCPPLVVALEVLGASFWLSVSNSVVVIGIASLIAIPQKIRGIARVAMGLLYGSLTLCIIVVGSVHYPARGPSTRWTDLFVSCARQVQQTAKKLRNCRDRNSVNMRPMNKRRICIL